MSRIRNVATILTVATVAFYLPAQTFAGPAKVDALKMDVKPVKGRPSSQRGNQSRVELMIEPRRLTSVSDKRTFADAKKAPAE